jgi:hypothetical protein
MSSINSNSNRRRPTRRRNHAFVALAFLVIVQQQWLIFLAGTTVAVAASAAAVSSTSSLADGGDEEAEAVAGDYSATVEVVTSFTHGTAEYRQDDPMEGEVSNGGRTNDEGAAGAVSTTNDVEATQQHEHGHHGGAAHVADDGELILKETTLASSPPDKSLDGEKVAAGKSIISFDNETPKINAADDELPDDFISDSNAHVVVDGDSSSSSMADHSNEIHDNAQLGTKSQDENNQQAIEDTAIPPDLEDHSTTMHPATTSIADTATTASITSSSDNPTIIVSPANEDTGSESNKDYSTTTYERIMYNSLFQSNIMEYDMMKFDPFSFSGAPLGGWGRATRSRLATLPLRLVVGNDGSGGLISFAVWRKRG